MLMRMLQGCGWPCAASLRRWHMTSFTCNNRCTGQYQPSLEHMRGKTLFRFAGPGPCWARCTAGPFNPSHTTRAQRHCSRPCRPARCQRSPLDYLHRRLLPHGRAPRLHGRWAARSSRQRQAQQLLGFQMEHLANHNFERHCCGDNAVRSVCETLILLHAQLILASKISSCRELDEC